MKEFIKSMFPGKILPIARKVHSRFFNSSEKIDLSKDYDDLSELQVLKCKISYNKHGGYCVPLSSHYRPAAQRILLNDVYEPETIDYMLQECRNGDIVHAGTYFGDFLPALSKAIASSAKIWAFEPNNENYRCARITCEINKINNVVLNNAGLGEKREILNIKTNDKVGRSLGGASKIVHGKVGDNLGLEAVQILTIDETISPDRDISIIQLDVEGYEKQALMGGLKTIQRTRPILIVEVLPNSTLLESDWFLDNILALGYAKSHDLHGNTVFHVT